MLPADKLPLVLCDGSRTPTPTCLHITRSSLRAKTIILQPRRVTIVKPRTQTGGRMPGVPGSQPRSSEAMPVASHQVVGGSWRDMRGGKARRCFCRGRLPRRSCRSCVAVLVRSRTNVPEVTAWGVGFGFWAKDAGCCQILSISSRIWALEFRGSLGFGA